MERSARSLVVLALVVAAAAVVFLVDTRWLIAVASLVGAVAISLRR